MEASPRAIVVSTPDELSALIRIAVRAEMSLAKAVSEEPPKEIFSEHQAATYIGQKSGTLRQWRSNSKGPAYHKRGRRVFYKKTDLDSWMAAGRKFTAETPDVPL